MFQHNLNKTCKAKKEPIKNTLLCLKLKLEKKDTSQIKLKLVITFNYLKDSYN
jgi:hypothetical protein